MAETPDLHRFPAKDPDEVLDYTYDFTELLQAAEKVASIDAVTVLPTTSPPLVVDSSGIVGPADKEVTVFLSGGENCAEYVVSVLITTDAGTPRTFERTCILPVQER